MKICTKASNEASMGASVPFCHRRVNALLPRSFMLSASSGYLTRWTFCSRSRVSFCQAPASAVGVGANSWVVNPTMAAITELGGNQSRARKTGVAEDGEQTFDELQL